ncbi:PilN domain-containing protein [Fulvimonas soli]|jgi:type IV pilus assembly protein PilN|uniref:Type IV pilus assembly protein PilN n=1 Tax=Fulvimonas soli TaxID=155197 RepID=A0A316HUB9_9GAMM|nr:PilN domain-containing protein [Fulvimonas soli]PWK83522.1 type IV pilus assembly protein PilN [Fulvimonas soli]TNY25500.1 fimbrial assembly protein [Fulvimonas soli]
MAHINLLPWRAERRKQREREFFLQLGAAFVAALLCLLLWAFWMGQRIDNQNERNAYLQGQIKQLDEKIAKIKDLEKVRQRLLARKEIIEQLQANRSQMVHLFDELVKTIPASARLTGLKQSGDSMSLDGVAQSNSSVAEYMRNIEASPWMGHADLRKTENTHGDSRMPYVFGLDVALSKPKQDENANAMPLLPAAGGSAAAPANAAPAAPPAAAGTAKPAPAPAGGGAAKPTAAAPTGGARP